MNRAEEMYVANMRNRITMLEGDVDALKVQLNYLECENEILKGRLESRPCPDCGTDLHDRDEHVCEDGEWR